MALTLGKHSLGVGDRFAREAEPQLAAFPQAARLGLEIVPVWNKSNREHTIVGTEPAGVREAARAAVSALGWSAPYFVDADHIDLRTVDRFLEASDCAFDHREELAAPYAAVIEIDPARLPSPTVVEGWTGPQMVAALRHEPGCPGYNPDLRQLLHIGYKMAARLGMAYLDMLQECRATVARNVTGNLFERHIRPIFLGPA